MKQRDRFRIVPWESWRTRRTCAAPAPTTTTGEERGRVTVTLATGIPEERVCAVDLDHLDAAEVGRRPGLPT